MKAQWLSARGFSNSLSDLIDTDIPKINAKDYFNHDYAILCIEEYTEPEDLLDIIEKYDGVFIGATTKSIPIKEDGVVGFSYETVVLVAIPRKKFPIN